MIIDLHLELSLFHISTYKGATYWITPKLILSKQQIRRRNENSNKEEWKFLFVSLFLGNTKCNVHEYQKIEALQVNCTIRTVRLQMKIKRIKRIQLRSAVRERYELKVMKILLNERLYGRSTCIKSQREDFGYFRGNS